MPLFDSLNNEVPKDLGILQKNRLDLLSLKLRLLNYKVHGSFRCHFHSIALLW